MLIVLGYEGQANVFGAGCMDSNACQSHPCSSASLGCTDLPAPYYLDDVDGRMCDACKDGYDGDGELCLVKEFEACNDGTYCFNPGATCSATQHQTCAILARENDCQSEPQCIWVSAESRCLKKTCGTMHEYDRLNCAGCDVCIGPSEDDCVFSAPSGSSQASEIAIIGGAVGGVVILAIIVLLIIFRKRKAPPKEDEMQLDMLQSVDALNPVYVDSEVGNAIRMSEQAFRARSHAVCVHMTRGKMQNARVLDPGQAASKLRVKRKNSTGGHTYVDLIAGFVRVEDGEHPYEELLLVRKKNELGEDIYEQFDLLGGDEVEGTRIYILGSAIEVWIYGCVFVSV